MRLLRNLVLTNFKHSYDKYQSEISRKHGNLEFRSSMPRLNFRIKISEVALRCTFARFPWPRIFPAPRCRALGHQSFHAFGDFHVWDISQSLSRLPNMSIYKSLTSTTGDEKVHWKSGNHLFFIGPSYGELYCGSFGVLQSKFWPLSPMLFMDYSLRNN